MRTLGLCAYCCFRCAIVQALCSALPCSALLAFAQHDDTLYGVAYHWPCAGLFKFEFAWENSQAGR